MVNAVGDEEEKRPAGFPYCLTLTWLDDETRAEAAVYYTSVKPAACSSRLVVHITAVRWLEGNRPQIGSVIVPAPPTATSILDKTNEPTVPASTPPRKLFP